MADLNALVRNPIVLSGAVAAVLVAAVAGGYFLGTGHSGSAGSGAGGTAAAAVGGVCPTTLARVQDFGITDAAAQLTSTDPTSTDTKGRVVCNAKDGATTYTITVDVLCDDMADKKCLKLYHVSDSAGATLFQRTKFLDPT